MRKRNKRELLCRATNLLEKNDDDVIQYAALELRQCVESIIYEKLQVYKKYVPGVVFEKWQPQHAIKMLLQFEPGADESFRMAIREEDEDGVASETPAYVGEHRSLSLSWLEKNYNKLGSYLHVPHTAGRKVDPLKVRKDLTKISEMLEDIVSKSTIIGAAIAERVHFTCGVCGQECFSNAEGVRKLGIAVCVKQGCGAIHLAEETEDGWTLQLQQTEFTCRRCEASTWLENRFLNVGVTFKCSACGVPHIIAGRTWAYGTKEDYDKHASQQNEHEDGG